MSLDPIKPYLYAAFVIGGLAILGGIYAKGRLDANHAAELAAKTAEITELKRLNERWARAYEIDAKQAALDQKDADLGAAIIEEIVSDVQDNPCGPAIGSHDADRVRQFAKDRDKARAPASAK